MGEKTLLDSKDSPLNTDMMKSIQLPIIEASTALWGMEIEKIVVILNFASKDEDNLQCSSSCIKSILKLWLANDQSTQ